MARRLPVAAAVLLSVGVTAWAEPTSAPVWPQVGARLEGRVGSDRSAGHVVELGPGRFIRLVLERKEADVALAVRDPAGGVLVEGDTLLFPPGPREMAFVTETGGAYTLAVRMMPGAPASAYTVTLLEERPAAPGDAERAGAERAYLEGERLRHEGKAEGLGRARALFEEVFATARRLGAAFLEADALTSLSRVREAKGEVRPALEGYEAALEIHRRLGRRRAVANVLNYASGLDDQLGERDRALRRLDEALVEARAIGDRRAEGLAHSNIGLVHYGRGERKLALEIYERALEAHRAAGNPRAEATTLQSISSVHDSMGDKALALEYAHRALALHRAVGDPRYVAGVLNNIGTVHFALDEIAQAVDFYRQAVDAWRAGGDPIGEGATLHNIARVHEATGHYEEALATWRMSLRMLREAGSKVREANVLTRLGRLYATMGDFRQALATYEEALGAHRSSGNRSFEAATLSNLGTLHASLGDPAQGATLQEQSLVVWRAIQERGGEAGALVELGRARAALGQREAARPSVEQGLASYRTLRNRRGEATALVQLAQLDHAAGRWTEASALSRGALEIFREVGDRLGEASALHALARAERDAGNLTAARDHSAAGVDLVETLRAGIASQELRAAFLATARDHYELLIDVLVRRHREDPAAGHDREALHVSERARARSLLDLLGEARASLREGIDPDLLARERRLTESISAKAARLSTLLTAKAPDEAGVKRLGREIDDLAAQGEALQSEIRARSPRYAALVHPKPIQAREIQERVLDGETALLEFALGAERSFVFAVTRETLDVHELPPRPVLERAARAFIQEVRSPPASGRPPPSSAAARRLAQALLAPVAGTLKSARRLVIVADGALLSLPFAALPDLADGRPLVAGHELVTLPSASTLAVLREETATRPRAPRAVAVLADPVFDSDDPRVRSRQREALVGKGGAPAVDRAGLGRLLGSRREARAILALAPSTDALAAFDFQASRALATSDELRRFRIVHLATHGVLDDVRPALSGVALSQVDERGRPQDGFLRLQDVYNLRWPADLVVLSACETGLGKEVRGEGLLGLARGFMYAGAPRVVTTLWKVDDRATAHLMGLFYEAMLGRRRLPPAAALRAAQRDMAADPQWQASFYWAGFVLQGEWR